MLQLAACVHKMIVQMLIGLKVIGPCEAAIIEVLKLARVEVPVGLNRSWEVLSLQDLRLRRWLTTGTTTL